VATFARNSKVYAELAFGAKLESVKSSLDSVLLCAILLVLLGQWMGSAVAPPKAKAAAAPARGAAAAGAARTAAPAEAS